MQKLQRLIIVLAFAVISAGAAAQTWNIGAPNAEDIVATFSNGKMTIKGTGAMQDWTSGINTPWYSIRDSITSLVIEDGVTSIGSYAFYSCGNVAGVLTIPNSVRSIGNRAFYYCNSLTSVSNRNVTPQIINVNVFSASTYTNATLYVSDQSVKDYGAATGWEEFSHIVPFTHTSINNTTAVTRVYPNPTDGMVYIETANGTVPALKLFSMQGKLLLETQGNEIDLSRFDKGVYLLEVAGETVKVIKK